MHSGKYRIGCHPHAKAVWNLVIVGLAYSVQSLQLFLGHLDCSLEKVHQSFANWYVVCCTTQMQQHAAGHAAVSKHLACAVSRWRTVCSDGTLLGPCGHSAAAVCCFRSRMTSCLMWSGPGLTQRSRSLYRTQVGWLLTVTITVIHCY